MGAYFQVFIINNLDWEIVFNYLFIDIRVYVVDNCGFYVQVQIFNKVSDYGWVCDRQFSKFYKYEEEVDLEIGVSKGWFFEFEVQSYDLDWIEVLVVVVIGGEIYGVSLEFL